MSQKQQFDLIVIGGGPAGSTLSSFVAMQGRKVLLLEREKFPRYQIGESLIPATVQGIAKMLGIQDELAAQGFPIKMGGTFRWGTSPEPWTFKFKDTPLLSGDTNKSVSYQVERAKFDNILLQTARKKGVDVRERHSVKSIIEDANGRVVGVRFIDADGNEQEAHAGFVADASGNTGTLYTNVGERVWSKFFRNMAVFGYWRGGKRLPDPFQGNILSAAFKSGWHWYIPLTFNSDLTSVGAVIPVEEAETLRTMGYEKAYLRYIEENGIIRDYLKDATRVTEGMYGQIRVRRDWSYMNSSFWRPGMVLLGDAACFVDPLFSSGVHLATYSALLVARSVNSALDGMDEKQCFAEYERRYRKEYAVFYDFLVAFYDMHQDKESYFWEARKVLKTEEKANEQFIRLVAGVSSAQEFFIGRDDVGERLQTSQNKSEAHTPSVNEAVPGFNPIRDELIHQAHEDLPTGNAPMFDDGLGVSDDGFHWANAPAAKPMQSMAK